MLYRKDVFSLPKNFPFNLFIAAGDYEHEPVLHFHDCLEINYILEGTGVNIIENARHRLVAKDLYIINNLEHHIAYSEDNSLKMLVIIFDPVFIFHNNPFDYEYLKPFFNRGMYFSNCIKGGNPIMEKLSDILLEIWAEWENRQEGYRLVIKANLMKMLSILYRDSRLAGEPGEDLKIFCRNYDRIREALEYIEDNLENDLELDTLANKTHMNRTYFSTFFKKVMKQNVMTYIETLRIDKASHLLKATGDNITEISLSCGFNSVSHFNRVFKKHILMSPGEYRQS